MSIVTRRGWDTHEQVIERVRAEAAQPKHAGVSDVGTMTRGNSPSTTLVSYIMVPGAAHAISTCVAVCYGSEFMQNERTVGRDAMRGRASTPCDGDDVQYTITS